MVGLIGAVLRDFRAPYGAAGQQAVMDLLRDQSMVCQTAQWCSAPRRVRIVRIPSFGAH